MVPFIDKLSPMLGFHTLREHERGLVIRFGKVARVVGPGAVFICPMFETLIPVDTQPATLFIPEQEVPTKDKAVVRVEAEVRYRVADPAKTVTLVEDYPSAMRLFCAITFRSVMMELDKDEIMKDREKAVLRFHELLTTTLAHWGIEVLSVDIQA
jgi:regulator of protease activity HflC (stomatin/prohibitin superfamily)